MKTKQFHVRAAEFVRSVLNHSARSVLFIFTVVFCGGGLSLPSVCRADAINDVDLPRLKRAVLTNYAAVLSASYQDSVDAVRDLQSAIDRFLAGPSEESLRLAREAWRAARVPYCQTEAARFYDGPTDQIE